MALTTGTRIGGYEVLGTLGAGGMGEVYRARDTKLDRDVAIKVLPDLFADDPDRLARFQREAKTLAALNHPNIATIHGVEEAAGLHALVMELVEGETLAERIAQGPVPTEEALRIARQIAEALQAAHEQGIIHRDLKPANIKVRPDGTVKVLDFGLAKALEAAPAGAGALSMSPTITSPAMATGVGVLLGTAAYMSPEQAKGKPADKRSDVWAFGCVLYEILTGHRAFAGENLTDVISAVVRLDPDWSALPAQCPRAIGRMLKRCLAKDPKMRLPDLAVVRFAIDDLLSGDAQEDAVAGAGPARAWWKRAMPVAVTAAIVGPAAAAAVWMATPAPSTTAVVRFSFALADNQAFSGTTRHLVAISPDGARIAYVANLRLYVRELASLEPRPLVGGVGQAVLSPVFGPDGQSLAFYSSDGTLKRISVAGGAAVTLCAADDPYGMSWDENGIVFGQGSKGIMRVSANGCRRRSSAGHRRRATRRSGSWEHCGCECYGLEHRRAGLRAGAGNLRGRIA